MLKHALVLLALSAAVLAQTPAERAIARAEQTIAKNPDRPEGHNELAMALARRARETSDSAFYLKAESELEKSLTLAPDHFEALKTRAWVMLGKHEFAKALELAKQLNRRMPDDVLVYGLLADAHAEIGNYKEALDAVQWMLDLRPGNVPALTRAAYLREIFGYVDGAIEFMSLAYQRTSPTQVEDRAWTLTQLAHLNLLAGKPDNADRLLQQALELFPRYHYALAGLAKVRTAQQKYEEAAKLLQDRYDAAPHPENLYDLAEALERAGRAEEAKAVFAEFEEKARAEMEKDDNSNRELIFYYADHAGNPVEALKIARAEIARRHDVHTLDAYTWALYVNGRHTEAREQMDKVLAIGLQDPKILRHALTCPH